MVIIQQDEQYIYFPKSQETVPNRLILRSDLYLYSKEYPISPTIMQNYFKIENILSDLSKGEYDYSLMADDELVESGVIRIGDIVMMGEVYEPDYGGGDYNPVGDAYTKAEADAKFLQKVDADAKFLSKTEADTKFLSKTDANFVHLQSDKMTFDEVTGAISADNLTVTAITTDTVLPSSGNTQGISVNSGKIILKDNGITLQGRGEVITNEEVEAKGYGKIWQGTQAEYDKITNKDNNTLYVIK